MTKLLFFVGFILFAVMMGKITKKTEYVEPFPKEKQFACLVLLGKPYEELTLVGMQGNSSKQTFAEILVLPIGNISRLSMWPSLHYPELGLN